MIQHRFVRTTLFLSAAVLTGFCAIYLLMHYRASGQESQVVNIRWTATTTATERRAAEARLGLLDGAEVESGTWRYRLQDWSTDGIRRIVTDAMVDDTNHIDRDEFTLLIDDPGVPRWLRAYIGTPLIPGLVALLSAASALLVWLVRRELWQALTFLGTLPGFDVAAALGSLLVGFGYSYGHGQLVDENNHYNRIIQLATGQWTRIEWGSTTPGFHALVASAVWLTGRPSELTVRLIVLILSVATVGLFYLLAKALDGESAGRRTLQFTLLPILFPQFFLIYTDVTSVLFVLWMMLALIRREYRLAGFLGLVACTVRQSNAIWVAFAVAWSYIRDYGWTWQPVGELLKRYWTFGVTGVTFLIFVAVNHGVALGDAEAHPIGQVHVTNLFFLLFLTCFLFLPLWWAVRRSALMRVRRLTTWIGVLGLFLVFWFGFVNDHPYNLVRPEFFLRNALLVYFSASPLHRLLFFLPVVVTWLSLPGIRLKQGWWLLYPFTILVLVPEWLVEQRYYLVPLSLFLVAREPATASIERVQTALFAVVGWGLFLVVGRGSFWM